MIERDVQRLMERIKECVNNIDDNQFKQRFLGYVEYMARNYDQDCILDEYNSLMNKVEQFAMKYQLNLKELSLYKYDTICRFVQDDYDIHDILDLYYFDGDQVALEGFIDKIDNKY